uniref:Uncharacterized protein n=1 Tax=Aegilops tauschii subsp. strangulata TaxID=200361 RepID=A0A453A2H8_AEGTS
CLHDGSRLCISLCCSACTKQLIRPRIAGRLRFQQANKNRVMTVGLRHTRA